MTTGEDNKIMCWDIKEKKLKAFGIIDDNTFTFELEQKDEDGIGKRIILYINLEFDSSFKPNQQSKCISYNSKNGNIAIGTNAGKISIRESIENLNKRVTKDIFFEENVQIYEISFSPGENSFLAVGTSKGDVFILSVFNSYCIYKAVKGLFASPIKNIDWDQNSEFIQICSKTIDYGFVNIALGRAVDGIYFQF